MKITRYTQSCMLVEDLPTQTSGKVSAGKSSRILIDPSGAEAENFAPPSKLNLHQILLQTAKNSALVALKLKLWNCHIA